MKMQALADIPANTLRVTVKIDRSAVEQLNNADLEALAQEVLGERTRRSIRFAEELESRAVEEVHEGLMRFVRDRAPTAFNAAQCLKIAQVFISRADELSKSPVFAMTPKRPLGY